MDEMRAMILAGAQEYKKAHKALKDNSKFVLFGDEYKRDHFPNASREDALWLNKKDIGVSFDSELIICYTFIIRGTDEVRCILWVDKKL